MKDRTIANPAWNPAWSKQGLKHRWSERGAFSRAAIRFWPARLGGKETLCGTNYRTPPRRGKAESARSPHANPGTGPGRQPTRGLCDTADHRSDAHAGEGQEVRRRSTKQLYRSGGGAAAVKRCGASADQDGGTLEARPAGGCWDIGTPAARARGGGETLTRTSSIGRRRTTTESTHQIGRAHV